MRYYDLTKETAYQYLCRTLAAHTSNDCLEWPFHKSKKGYGILVHPETRRCVLAHRVAFKLAYGHWPEPLGRHTCDNPSCYSAAHIIEGTVQDNANDMMARGRLKSRHGEEINTAKLTEAQVREIKLRYVMGNGVLLANEFGVSQGTITHIMTGRAWKHVK